MTIRPSTQSRNQNVIEVKDWDYIKFQVRIEIIKNEKEINRYWDINTNELDQNEVRVFLEGQLNNGGVYKEDIGYKFIILTDDEIGLEITNKKDSSVQPKSFKNRHVKIIEPIFYQVKAFTLKDTDDYKNIKSPSQENSSF
nr:13412_t:CDS:2 [Entrophospora candida]